MDADEHFNNQGAYIDFLETENMELKSELEEADEEIKLLETENSLLHAELRANKAKLDQYHSQWKAAMRKIDEICNPGNEIKPYLF